MNVFSPSCLEGKFFLVTGATSGLGRETAKLIAKCGGSLALSGRNSEELYKTVQQLEGVGHKLCPYSFDTSDDIVVPWVRALMINRPPLSGVFHAAGVEDLSMIEQSDQSSIAKVFDANLYSSFGLARALSLEGALSPGASVVFMSCIASIRAGYGSAAYSASKAGLNALVRSLAVELSSKQVRVNSIVAGGVKTPMLGRILASSTDEASADYISSHKLGLGDPQDIASAAVFLLSDAARWITGTSLVVDGGATL